MREVHLSAYGAHQYYVLANGLAKAFNKTLSIILKKMVDKNKRT